MKKEKNYWIAKRCKICHKIIRSWNKSLLCTGCSATVNNHKVSKERKSKSKREVTKTK